VDAKKDTAARRGDLEGASATPVKLKEAPPAAPKVEPSSGSPRNGTPSVAAEVVEDKKEAAEDDDGMMAAKIVSSWCSQAFLRFSQLYTNDPKAELFCSKEFAKVTRKQGS
jgi:hypothetical protein